MSSNKIIATCAQNKTDISIGASDYSAAGSTDTTTAQCRGNHPSIIQDLSNQMIPEDSKEDEDELFKEMEEGKEHHVRSTESMEIEHCSYMRHEYSEALNATSAYKLRSAVSGSGESTSSTIDTNESDSDIEVPIVLAPTIRDSSTQCDFSSGPGLASTTDVSIKVNNNGIASRARQTYASVNFDVSDDSSFDGDDENIMGSPTRFMLNTPSRNELSNTSQVNDKYNGEDEDEERGLDEILMCIPKTTVSPRVSRSSRDTRQISTLSKENMSQLAEYQYLGPSPSLSTGTTTPHKFRCDRSRSLSPSRTTIISSTSKAQRIPFDHEEQNFESCEEPLSSYLNGDNASIQYAQENDDVLDNSAMLTAATTITLDEHYDADGGIPRMTLAPRRRNKDEFNNVKEVVVNGPLGVTTTIVLTFGNTKTHDLKMFAKAIQMRFDSFQASQSSQQHSNVSADNILSEDVAFDVTPRTMLLAPREQASFYITFTPTRLGVYSGVLKIRTDKKSFVLLLRGESSRPSPQKSFAGINDSRSPDELERSLIGSKNSSPSKVAYTQMPRSVSCPPSSLSTRDNIKSLRSNVSESSNNFVSHSSVINEQYKNIQSQFIGASSYEHDFFNNRKSGNNSERANYAIGQDVVKIGNQDPLLLRQKWVREWLQRSKGKGYVCLAMAPQISQTAINVETLGKVSTPEGKNKTYAAVSAQPNSPSLNYVLNRNETASSLSVMPSSLRLLPQRLEVRNQSGNSALVNTGLLEGTLLVRNFSSEDAEIGVSTSSVSISIKSGDRFIISGHDAVRVVVEYNPRMHKSSRYPTRLGTAGVFSPPGSIPSDPDHIGYVMISSSKGEEFVTEIRMSPQSCLSPAFVNGIDVSLGFLKEVSIKKFHNPSLSLHDDASPCMPSIPEQNSDLINASLLRSSIKSSPVLTDIPAQDALMLLANAATTVDTNQNSTLKQNTPSRYQSEVRGRFDATVVGNQLLRKFRAGKYFFKTISFAYTCK